MTFYGDLKKIRREKEIDLGEVANRTKINQAYLESIEKGDYTFLPHVYVRLFLRAYTVEIGADPDEAKTIRSRANLLYNLAMTLLKL